MTCSGGDKINWHAHDLKWCSENKDHCPPKPPIVPVLNYQLKPWSQVIRPPMQCTRPVGDAMPKVTVVILAYKETESLSASLATYDAAGFLQVWFVYPNNLAWHHSSKCQTRCCCACPFPLEH